MLNIDPIVRIEVDVGTSMASAGVFDVGAIIGSTAVAGIFDANHRYKEYESLADMASDGFLPASDEYKAAAKYFGVTPSPDKLVMVYFDSYSDAEAYSAESTYAVGDRCIYSEKLYVCTTAIESGEAWNSEHWQEIASPDTPVSAMIDAFNSGAEFYAVYYITPQTTSPTTVASVAIPNIASAFDALNRGVVFYGVTGTVESVTESGLFPAFVAADTRRALGLYCTESEDDAAGLMGEAMGLSRTNTDSAFALCYKTVASATVNDIIQSDVNKIKKVNGNVYVKRTRARAFVENGAVANGLRFDDVLYVDRMSYDIQQSIYALIADSATKLPQNDATSAIFLNTIHGILERYYTMGVLDTAIWRGASVDGKIEKGDYVEHGHAEFVDSFDTQSEEDRLLHKAMPITILLCLSGSVESIVITVDVQT